MEVKFAKMNPTENMTILVRNPVPRARQGAVAERLMAYDSVGGEQVGFVEPAALPGARARLQMMGGEFCGNASMSLAALLAREDGLPLGGVQAYCLEVSGASEAVRCQIRREQEAFVGRVAMPLPQSVEEFELLPGLKVPLVRFEGIVHAIVPEGALAPEVAVRQISQWCARSGAGAFGAMLMEGGGRSMRPLVYVRATSSCVWERGCGSGTAAVGCWKAAQAQADCALSLRQPGGEMGVHVRWQSARVAQVEIQGQVKLAAEGIAWIDLD